ncbi:MAG TPA: gamma carbonic anhydrase family protein [Steroidobacteraceae bacterium]|nr:gamma carbonic anhydrase family protein [Steroidobacteraceae bacterium]
MIYALGDKRIVTASDEWYVAPGASVIGQVRLGIGASIWFNCVIRADSDWIVLGDRTNVQDGTIIHTDAGVPVHLGSDVSVGHGAMLHGCTVEEGSLIANGAIVLDGVRIGRRCVIAAGALIPPGKVIPDRSVVMGTPGKIVREIDERDLEMMVETTKHYVDRGREYARTLTVDARSIELLDTGRR